MNESKRIGTVSFSQEHRTIILRTVSFFVEDEKLKESLESFFANILYREYSSINTVKRTVTSLKRSIQVLGNSLSNLEDISWEIFCTQMQEIERLHKNKGFMMRGFFIDFYTYLAENHSDQDIKNNINSFSHLMLRKEVNPLNESQIHKFANIEILDEIKSKIRTHFPLGSSSKQMYQTNIESQTNTKYITNIYIRVNDQYLYTLLSDFTEYYKKYYKNSQNVVATYAYRLFQYYFEISIKKNKITINGLSSFNLDTFMQQYKFFADIKECYGDELGLTQSGNILNVLTHFYAFINDSFYQQTTRYLFSTKLIFNHNFVKALLNGYVPVYQNAYESIPTADKWVLLDQPNHKRTMYSLHNGYIDFSLIKNKVFREDLKEFLWVREAAAGSLKKEAKVLINFLNAAENNFKENSKVINFQGENVKEYFSGMFLLKYQAVMKLRMTSNGTVISAASFNGEINPIRVYLKYYQNKYNISEVTLSQLRYSAIENDGGNPMTPNDFKLIQKEFREKSYNDPEKELMFIVFQLCCTTKLRIGEVLHLERDCIISIDESLGIGEVAYYSKTSYREKITEIFLIEDIKLIQRAKEITEHLVSEALGEDSKYVFLLKYSKKRNVVGHMTSQYVTYFSRVIDNLKSKGLLEKSYTAKGSRHTFIDTTWKAVEDGQINILEVGVITGNTPRVASKHYRLNDAVRYIEATYMIVVGDVTIQGEIIEEEEEIADLPQVEYGAGACQSNECIKLEVEMEDSDYKCLTCKKFVTSVERLSIFEKRLNFYKAKKDAAKHLEAEKYYQGLIDLYAAFLTEMLSKEKG
ncbi:hypothetical protein [Priestia megaterium]|uniref:hypothetical protein n=1 Tax=Priestia megaterium TaxID=1404 RepID=UPI002EC8B542|nr:hypothetical protein [Priestia megaterium]